MNINIQVDQSVYTGSRENVAGLPPQTPIANQEMHVSFTSSSSSIVSYNSYNRRNLSFRQGNDDGKQDIQPPAESQSQFINRTTIALDQIHTMRGKHNSPSESGNKQGVFEPGKTERISFNVTITNIGGSRFHSNIDISNQQLINYPEHNDKQECAIVKPSDKVEVTQKQDDEQMAESFKKYQKYDRRSIYVFHSSWVVRQKVINLVRGKYFNYFMLLSILGNSVSMSLTNYADDENLTQRNQILDKVDQVFTGVYTAEAALKIIAFGFVLHKRSYLRDPWNFLDFTVVIIGLISLIPNVPNLKSLRTMRVLRPLRSINAVPSMKRLIGTLLMSLPQMGYLVLFMLYFIAVFAIMGIQFFARDIYHRCRLTDQPFLDERGQWQWPIDENQQRCCGGFYVCSESTYCHALFEKNIPLEVDQVWTWDFLQYGFFQFDNLGTAMLSVFRVMSLQGWSGVLYRYMDSTGIEAVIYFPLLIVIGAFFMLNLFLAVIMSTFTEMRQAKALEIKQKKEKKQRVKKMIISLMAPQGNNNIAPSINETESQQVSSFEAINNRQIEDAVVNTISININQTKGATSKKTICGNTQQLFIAFCMNKYFQFMIIAVIIMNTIVLGLDAFPIDSTLQGRLEMINNVFFGIFFLEMCAKITGLGLVGYVKDLYNLFDAFIVILSIADVTLSQALPNGQLSKGGGAMSVFRTFRLLRVFKLVKSLTKLQSLLKTIMRSLKDIGSFVVLLFLLIFIYLLIGLEIFAIKPNSSPNYPDFVVDRRNFNTFIDGFIVLFVTLTGDNWDDTMFHFGLQRGWIAIFFFISFIIVGQMIFMNLFLAIVLDNFDISDLHSKSDDQVVLQKGTFFDAVINAFSKITQQFQAVIAQLEVSEPPTIAIKPLQDEEDDQEQTKQIPLFESIKKRSPLSKISVLEEIKEIDEEPSPEKQRKHFFPKQSSEWFRQDIIQEAEKKNIDENYLQNILDDSPSTFKFRLSNLQNPDDQSEELSPVLCNSNNERSSWKQNSNANLLVDVEPSSRVSPKSDVSRAQSIKKTKSVFLRSSILTKKQPKIVNSVTCQGNSLFCLTSKNRFRIAVTTIIQHNYFERFILTLITISSILLAFENPLNDPQSLTVKVLTISDYILTTFFALEAVFKIISLGLLLNGEVSYLRSAWNMIDFLVVLLSIVSLCLTSSRFESVKILRLLRVMRPLRVISRNKGLKIGIQALFMSIPSLINVIIISLFSFVIFGTIGVNFLKGTFYYCYVDSSFPQDIQDNIGTLVITKYDCLNIGGTWINADQNFDNLLSAMLALFNIATVDGWSDVMYNGIDSVGIDMQPVENNNKFWSVYFIITIVVCSFLIMNLFVGVVVQTFNSERERLGKSFLLTEHQKKWLEQKKLCMNIQPKMVIKQHTNKCRDVLRQIVVSVKFEMFIITCITLNTIVLCLYWYSQTEQVYHVLNYLNYAFALIFALEACLKLIAFGVKPYLRDNGNVFDFIIVILSILSSAISLPLNNDFGSRSTFIRAMRLSKVLKYMKNAQHINIIIDTFVFTLPALSNIGGLLVLFLYIYSVLGVFLFAEVQLQSNLTGQANFQSFGIAFLTLLRCSTGEQWVSIMMDATRGFSVENQCDSGEFSYATYLANGKQTMGCGQQIGKLYFITFYLMVPIIFLNLFIAIILQGFEQTSDRVNILISDTELERFKQCWAHFDQNATGYIKITDIEEFLFLLGEPLGWGEELYRNNQQLRDNFLVELNIKTYNQFKDFLFYDVIQGLSKIYMVHKELKKEKDNQFEDQDIFETQQSVEEAQEKKGAGGDHRQKMKLIHELDFQNHSSDLLQDVTDINEAHQKESRLKKSFADKEDTGYSSAHLKAGRMILSALKRIVQKKERIQRHSTAKQREKTIVEDSVFGDQQESENEEPQSKPSAQQKGDIFVIEEQDEVIHNDEPNDEAEIVTPQGKSKLREALAKERRLIFRLNKKNISDANISTANSNSLELPVAIQKEFHPSATFKILEK